MRRKIDNDTPGIAIVLHGISEKIQQHLFQPLAVGQDNRARLDKIGRLDSNSTFHRERPNKANRFAHCVGHTHRLK